MDQNQGIILPEGFVDFFKKLESWQNQEIAKIRKSIQHEKVDIKKIIRNNPRPLIDQKKPVIDVGLFKESFTSLIDYLITLRPEIKSPLEVIAANSSKLDYTLILEAGLTSDSNVALEHVEEQDLPAELFFFVLDHAIRPYLRCFAEPYNNDILAEDFYWQFHKTCPLCGCRANICRLRAEDGIRLMFCDHCFSEWQVRYLFCIYCENDVPGEISVIQIEDNSSYALYVCDKCKGYIKTYDERPSGRTTDLFVANMETIFLDLLAERRGYTTHD